MKYYIREEKEGICTIRVEGDVPSITGFSIEVDSNQPPIRTTCSGSLHQCMNMDFVYESFFKPTEEV